MSRVHSKPVLALAAGLAGMLLAGCSAPAATPTSEAPTTAMSTPEAPAKTEATIAVFQELNTIDPPFAIDSNSSQAINNFLEGLYRLGEGNTPVPAGAVDLPEISADGLIYTIKLNPAAKWSDGTPVTAADYEFAWKRAVGLENAGENQKFFGAIAGANEIIAGDKKPDELAVTAVDDTTLTFTLANPTSYFTSLLAAVAFFPLKQAYVEEQGEAFGSDSEHGLYNGPFTLADFSGPGLGSGWSYVRNENYWDTANVFLDKINVQVIKDTNTAINLYKAGEVDQVLISGPQVQANQADPGFVAYQTATSAFLGYNQTKPAFQNPKVRKAISLVIDRAALAANVLADGSSASTGLVPPGLAANTAGEDFAAAAGDALSTDVEQAKALWAEAKAELGISELAIGLQTFDSDRVKSVSEYLQGVIQTNLEGTTVEIGLNPVANFLQKVNGGEFDVYLVTWGADFPDPSAQLGLFRSDAGSNWGKYNNPAFDAALTAAQTTHATDPAARWADLLEAQRILLEDQGGTPVFFQSQTLLRNPALEGVVFHTSGPAFTYKSAKFTS